MVCPNEVGRYPKAKINSVAKKWVKNIFHKCKHGYKHFACLYVSNGADRPMVTIIGYNNGFTYYRCVYVCVCMVHACVHVCMNFMKKAFSQ